MLKELRQQLDQKTISATELTQQFLQRIEEQNPALNAYVLVVKDYALAQAKVADALIASGKSLALTGIPYALKDVFCVTGIETTACSNILKGYIPPYSATVAHTLRDQGAVLLGKTNTDEFTMGASTETSCFGPTVNPYDHTKVAGGSSGGSAAAVAMNLAAFALGTDTGGSIRQPAAFCGIVGLRPTYGRVSRYGTIAMASSLDTVGPLAESVADVAILMEILAGQDKFDSTTMNTPVESYSKLLEQPLPKFKVGIPHEYFDVAGLDFNIRQRLEAVIAKLKKLGIEIVDISLPHTKYATPTYYVICPCEVSSNLARYDGIKYGYCAHNAEELEEVYALSRQQGFGPEAKRRIMIGTYALSAGYYEAYYHQATKVRTLIKQDFDQAFKQVDLILTAATPTTAFAVGAKTKDPVQMYLADIFNTPAALAGIPGLVVSGGKVNGLPVGVQILGPQWSEGVLLQFGQMVEKLYKN